MEEVTPHAMSSVVSTEVGAAVIGTDEWVRLLGDGLGLTASAATAQRLAVNDLEQRRLLTPEARSASG